MELTNPHIQGRQKLPNLSRNLKRNIEDVVGPSTSEAPSVIEEAGTRKICAVCPAKKRRMTRFQKVSNPGPGPKADPTAPDDRLCIWSAHVIRKLPLGQVVNHKFFVKSKRVLVIATFRYDTGRGNTANVKRGTRTVLGSTLENELVSTRSDLRKMAVQLAENYGLEHPFNDITGRIGIYLLNKTPFSDAEYIEEAVDIRKSINLFGKPGRALRSKEPNIFSTSARAIQYKQAINIFGVTPAQDDDDAECIFCSGKLSEDTKGQSWFMYLVCSLWVHTECAVAETENYVFDFCC
ncbi:hypothetical protein J6590_023290 [Homalodisca vitripennis]|nr:hypothetical protein J6590_023290 [Homalodisca vitripennis]